MLIWGLSLVNVHLANVFLAEVYEPSFSNGGSTIVFASQNLCQNHRFYFTIELSLKLMKNVSNFFHEERACWKKHLLNGHLPNRHLPKTNLKLTFGLPLVFFDMSHLF